MTSKARPHVVAVLVVDGVLPMDMGMPCEVFGRAGGEPEPRYRVMVCGHGERIRAGLVDLALRHGLEALAVADTIVVPGMEDINIAYPEPVLEGLRAAAARGARIASICSGAFVLAAAGLLDGRRATTHWLATRAMARRYPAIEVDPDVLFVDGGQVLTSAGAAAGIDLCLHMVRQDHGAAVAADCARLAVVPLERQGGQAQYITHAPPGSAASLAPLLEWMAANPREDLSLDVLAARAGMSTRTFSRRFREQTGTTPHQWTLILRIRRVQALLETTRLSIEQIATETGFASAPNLRERFSKVVGASPHDYRRAFGLKRRA